MVKAFLALDPAWHLALVLALLVAGFAAWGYASVARGLRPNRKHVSNPATHIARINTLTATGRTNWFGLLAYLVFAFITLLGVEDADFFLPTRQTKLPLVGIDIPTESFFFFAPVLGTALYVYLHLYVRKVTAALCAAPPRALGEKDAATADPTPLERHITPWLLNDFVLRWRRDGAIDRKPLDGLADLIAIALVWIAGPFVLFGFWVRSWPAHNQAITTLAGLCLILALYAGHVSWVRMTRDLRGDDDGFRLSDWARHGIVAVLGAGVIWLGWIKTESGQPYDKVAKASASMTGSISVFVSTLPNLLYPKWWGALTPARLSEVQFAALPPDDNDPDAALARFRKAWCDRHGMDAATCGDAPAPGRAPYPKAGVLHDAWCDTRGIARGEACADAFGALEDDFSTEWQSFRKNTIAALAKPDLREADLRGADLSRAKLTGVVLREARLDGANLVGAEMEGANLGRAQMQGADLRGAQMQGANLGEAQMQGADLVGAQMQGANLVGAQMQGADLVGAQMQGADLRGAQMQGADLVGAQMQGAILVGAQMQGAILWEAQLQSASWAGATSGASPAHEADFRAGTDMSQSGLSSLIGNAATLLPERLEDSSQPFVCSCWAADPPGLEHLIALASERYDTSEAELRSPENGLFCQPGERPQKTGTPWPLDAELPWGAQAEGEGDDDYDRRRTEWAAAQPGRGFCDE